MKRLKNLRQGQTRWLAIIYDVDDNEYVAVVYRCFITSVKNATVKYDCGSEGYICGRKWFVDNTAPTYRKAIKQANDSLRKMITI